MGASWLSKGQASQQLAKTQQVMQEKKQSEQGKMWRFYLKPGEEASITFVDGELSPEGFLLPPRFFEHNLFLNNQWNNFFVCPEHTNPAAKEKCPICESGDSPALIAVFTIIDHRVTHGKKDPTKTYKDRPMLLCAKPQTFEMLNKLAIKRGGLAGCTFDVSRGTDKDAAVGSLFDFTSKEADLDVLRAKYTRTYEKDNKKITETFFKPADYENELVYRTEAELREMGFGKAPTMGGAAAVTAADYSDQM